MTPYVPQRRPSWRGVLAGLLMGLIVVMTMLALALVLGSFLPFSLQGTSITAGVYAIITALVSAFVAGYFAVKASAPETLFGDGTSINPKDAGLIGMLTAAAIVLATTYFTMSSATSIVSSVARTAGSAVSTVAQTATSGLVAGTTMAGAAAQNPSVQNQAQQVYQRLTGDISRQDIERMIAKNSANLNQEQVSATANVLEGMVNRVKGDLQQMDFTDADTWANLDNYAKQRAASIEQTLQGPELLQRLQQQGLSQQQAMEVRQEAMQTFNEYKVQTEQFVAKTRQDVQQTLQQAEEAARKAALYTGLFWLISTLLTFLASMAGARKAAANYRLDRPIVTRQ